MLVPQASPDQHGAHIHDQEESFQSQRPFLGTQAFGLTKDMSLDTGKIQHIHGSCRRQRFTVPRHSPDRESLSRQLMSQGPKLTDEGLRPDRQFVDLSHEP